MEKLGNNGEQNVGPKKDGQKKKKIITAVFVSVVVSIAIAIIVTVVVCTSKKEIDISSI